MNFFVSIALPILLSQFLPHIVVASATKNSSANADEFQNWAIKLITSESGEPVEKIIAKTVQNLKIEFSSLQHPDATAYSKNAFNKNKQKNRYPDKVFLIEESRVVLDYEQYIHANHVHVSMHEPDDKKFICTQGPMDADEKGRADTQSDFWQMVVQHNVDAILMVTDPWVGKCAQYWPMNKTKELCFKNPSGTYIIKNIKQENLEFKKAQENLKLEDKANIIIVRTELEVEYRQKKKKIMHFHWKEWPDHDVPDDFIAPIKLWDALKEYKNVVVHCNAGIGRTGTIVAIEIGQNLIRKNAPFDIKTLVEDLRKQRAHSVQNLKQYLYIYNVFLSLAKEKMAKENIEKMDELINAITKEINNPNSKQEEDPLTNAINKRMENFHLKRLNEIGDPKQQRNHLNIDGNKRIKILPPLVI